MKIAPQGSVFGTVGSSRAHELNSSEVESIVLFFPYVRVKPGHGRRRGFGLGQIAFCLFLTYRYGHSKLKSEIKKDVRSNLIEAEGKKGEIGFCGAGRGFSKAIR